MRRTLHAVAKGLQEPSAYLDLVSVWSDDLGSHRELGTRHVSILDEHDHVSGDKLNAAPGASFEVVVNTEQAATGAGGQHPVGQVLQVQYRKGNAYLPIRDLGPSEVLLLANH